MVSVFLVRGRVVVSPVVVMMMAMVVRVTAGARLRKSWCWRAGVVQIGVQTVGVDTRGRVVVVSVMLTATV